MPNVSETQSMFFHWQKIKKLHQYKELITRKCEFFNDGFCEKQQMKCSYNTDQCKCDYFRQSKELTPQELLSIPETWFVNRYLELIYYAKDRLRMDSYFVKSDFIRMLRYKHLGRWEDQKTIETWVNTLLEYVSKVPDNIIKEKIKQIDASKGKTECNENKYNSGEPKYYLEFGAGPPLGCGCRRWGECYYTFDAQVQNELKDVETSAIKLHKGDVLFHVGFSTGIYRLSYVIENEIASKRGISCKGCEFSSVSILKYMDEIIRCYKRDGYDLTPLLFYTGLKGCDKVNDAGYSLGFEPLCLLPKNIGWSLWNEILDKNDGVIFKNLNKSAVIGAVIGDIVGSRFEFEEMKSKEFKLFENPLPYETFAEAMTEYKTKCRFTDDSVMTIALAKALLDANGNYENLSDLAIQNMREFGGHKYPFARYGGGFKSWPAMPVPVPYNSYGNGSAMRISAVPYFAESLEEVKELSRKVTEVTHNHPEGLKGAEAVASAIWLALDGYGKEYICKYIEDNYYSLDYIYELLVLTYGFNETCQETVPQSLFAFLISDSYEDAIRTAISMGGDADTMACIAGAVAGAYYGVPEDIEKEGLEYLTDELREIVVAVEDVKLRL